MFLNKKIYHVFVSLAVVALIASPFVYNKVKAATGLSVGSSSVTGSDDIIYGHGGDSTGNLLNLLNNSGASFVIDNSGNLDLSGTINSGGFTGTLNASNVSAGTFGSNTGGGIIYFQQVLALLVQAVLLLMELLILVMAVMQLELIVVVQLVFLQV
jgi:hypothetical protein